VSPSAQWEQEGEPGVAQSGAGQGQRRVDRGRTADVDCAQRTVSFTGARATSPVTNFNKAHTKVGAARNSRRAVGKQGSTGAHERVAAASTAPVKLGTVKVPPKNPIDMGARADCRRAAVRVSDSSVKKQKQVKFMLPGEDSPKNGDAFASARAKQEAGEHGSPRTAMPKWQWQGGAVKWANSTASAK
jgi:hypothetical protein